MPKGPLRNRMSDSQYQVIVKLKRTRQVRSVLRAAATEGRMPKKRGPLDRILQSKKMVSMEPIFGEIPERGVQGFRRMAVAADSEKENSLAGLNVISLISAKEAKAACSELKKDSLVDYAYVAPERYLLKAPANQEDPLVNRQWGLPTIQLFRAERTAAFPSSTDGVVAVIDSGIDSSHPDLQGIILDERNFTMGSLKDTSGHGTHVCGIIAAVRNNARGIRGVIQSRNIMSLKALDPYNAPGYYQALRYATDSGATVINLSLGGAKDPTEEVLVKRAIQRGVVVVAAMGNEKMEGNPTSYPAAIAGVIAVGATDETDQIADFSNTGRHIDVVAPGVNILSTIPTYPTSLADGTDYEAWPGTSMAAPHVSAAVALLHAKNSAATVAKIRNALVKGADKVAGQNGFSSVYGHGRLNILKALKKI